MAEVDAPVAKHEDYAQTAVPKRSDARSGTDLGWPATSRRSAFTIPQHRSVIRDRHHGYAVTVRENLYASVIPRNVDFCVGLSGIRGAYHGGV
jgi:hypothetical protein